MFITYKILFLSIFFYCSSLAGQNTEFPSFEPKDLTDTITFKQIKTDTLFNSNQIISLLAIKKHSKKYRTKFSYKDNILIKTSELAKESNSIAAINGGFFNMDVGGSVTYFEINDTVINYNKSSKNKWGKPKNLMNGAIIINKNDEIIIDYARSEEFYKASKQEKTVLVTGPVLIHQSKKTKMPDLKFVKKRHPRTCLCHTDDSLIFITIDGRQSKAQGMTLYEVQDYLVSLNCVNAINLDGGGSTTMWIKNKRVVNFPSDKSGERPISNILYIYKK